MYGNSSQKEALRRFNRFYTQRIGVLTDRYLGQARPLGEARVLFEIGSGCADVRELRRVLGLDSGYLSRLLRSLERQSLIRTRTHASDTRVRTAELTAAGRRALDELDARSNRVAADLLSPLTADQRLALLGAMETVERLLRLAGMVVEVIDPRSADARYLLGAFANEVRGRFPGGFDEAALVPPEEVEGAAGAFVAAREHDHPVGYGLLRTLAPGVGEIRHLWVDATARGLGLGRRLLAELEQQSSARGHQKVRLDTHEVLTEAIELYRTSGYVEIPRYDDNPYAHHWFEKPIAASFGS